MRYFILTLMGILIGTHPALARPVSYPGGWSSMIMNDGDENALHIIYSPTASYSIGVLSEYRRDADYWLNSVQVNNLLKRWNMPDSQANLYLQSGLGMAYSDEGEFDGKREMAGFTGLAADWENRRFFTSYANRYIEAGDIDSQYMQSSRVGITPYIGDYGDLHTWLMLEVEHKPEDRKHYTVTPLIRIFKGLHLVEAGMSNQGDVMFNWTIQY